MIYNCIFFTKFYKTVTRTTNNNNNVNNLVCIHFRVFGYPGNWMRGGAWADGKCHIDDTGPAITVRSGQTGKTEPCTLLKVCINRFNTIAANSSAIQPQRAR